MSKKNTKIGLPLDGSKAKTTSNEIITLVIMFIIVIIMVFSLGTVYNMTKFEEANTTTIKPLPESSKINSILDMNRSIVIPDANESDGVRKTLVFGDLVLDEVIPEELDNVPVVAVNDLNSTDEVLDRIIQVAQHSKDNKANIAIVAVETNKPKTTNDNRAYIPVKKFSTVEVKKVKRVISAGKKSPRAKYAVRRSNVGSSCSAVIVMTKSVKDTIDKVLTETDGAILHVDQMRDIIKKIDTVVPKNTTSDGSLIVEIANHYSEKNIEAIWNEFD